MRKASLYFILLSIGLLSVSAAFGQTSKTGKITSSSLLIRSGAFAEVLLRTAEYESELESLLLDYTEEFPKVKELRFGISRLFAEKARLSALTPADNEKATTALGKLMVRKVELETDLWKLQQTYADNHADVRRAKRKVEIFEKAIKEILG